ncbi:MAG: LEA type 2 family protein [Woeseiaceae bacterium]
MATTYFRFQSMALAVVVLTLLSACVGIRPGFETPTVTVKSLRALPSESALPDFEIVLNVLNPNNESLKLSGVSYTVSLAGHDVVKGVGNDLPVIEGYGEADLTLTASANLFAGIGLIRDLMSSPNDNIPYEFEAKLDPGPLSPSIRIKDKGEISLNPGAVN